MISAIARALRVAAGLVALLGLGARDSVRERGDEAPVILELLRRRLLFEHPDGIPIRCSPCTFNSSAEWALARSISGLLETSSSRSAESPRASLRLRC